MARALKELGLDLGNPLGYQEHVGRYPNLGRPSAFRTFPHPFFGPRAPLSCMVSLLAVFVGFGYEGQAFGQKAKPRNNSLLNKHKRQGAIFWFLETYRELNKSLDSRLPLHSRKIGLMPISFGCSRAACREIY